MALNDNATLVIGAGNFFRAPVGTAMPDDLTSTPYADWENIGHTSLEDILSWNSEGGEQTTLGTLQAKTLRTTHAPRTDALQFILQQWDRRSLRLYFGANAKLLANNLLTVPSDPAVTESAFLAVFIDGENHFAIYAPKAELFRADDISLADAESLSGMPIGVKPVNYSGNDWAYAVTPIGGIEATGATAGIPGIYTPDGADVPYNLAALSGVTADPATAWTVGQYVPLEDGTTAYWDGAEWQAGSAPSE